MKITRIDFICNPVATKEMWDEMHDVHPETLSLCAVVKNSSKDHSYHLPWHVRGFHGMMNSRDSSSSQGRAWCPQTGISLNANQIWRSEDGTHAQTSPAQEIESIRESSIGASYAGTISQWAQLSAPHHSGQGSCQHGFKGALKILQILLPTSSVQSTIQADNT